MRLYMLLVSAMAAGCSLASSSSRPAPSREHAAFRRAVDSMVTQPAFRNAHWGILVVDPTRNDTLYSHNAGKLFMPASNQKILTGATALSQLGADFRFRTRFASNGRLVGGSLRGDLVVIGRGDPTFSDAAFGDAMKPLRAAADAMVREGVPPTWEPGGVYLLASDTAPDRLPLVGPPEPPLMRFLAGVNGRQALPPSTP